MPRYVVERTFPKGLTIPMNEDGKKAVANVIAKNAELGVTWVQTFVAPGNKQTYCVYDGPTPEAVRRVADMNGLPVDRITEVTVLDPYFYRA